MPFINENLFANPALMQQFTQNEYPKLRKAFRGLSDSPSQSGRTVNYEEDAYLYCIESAHLEVREDTFAFVHKGCVLEITAKYRRENYKNYPGKSILEVPVHWSLLGIMGIGDVSDPVHTLQLIKEAFIKHQGGGGLYRPELVAPTTVSCLVNVERADPEFVKMVRLVFPE